MTDWLYRTPHAFPNKKLFRLGLACNYGIDEAGKLVCECPEFVPPGAWAARRTAAAKASRPPPMASRKAPAR